MAQPGPRGDFSRCKENRVLHVNHAHRVDLAKVQLHRREDYSKLRLRRTPVKRGGPPAVATRVDHVILFRSRRKPATSSRYTPHRALTQRAQVLQQVIQRFGVPFELRASARCGEVPDAFNVLSAAIDVLLIVLQEAACPRRKHTDCVFGRAPPSQTRSLSRLCSAMWCGAVHRANVT